MTKKRGLGKGLAALIPEQKIVKDNPVQDSEYRYLNLNEIKPNPNQPREKMDENKLMELMESIKTHGLIQPIVVRPKEKMGYEIIAGERRWRACRKLEMKQVPVVIKNYNDLEASAAALIENIQREDLNAVEEALAYKQLMSDYGLTQEELSSRVGKSRPFIANMVRLLTLPGEIKEMLAEGVISTGHARALVALGDSETQIKYTLKIIRKHLSVRKTEELIRRHLKEATQPKKTPQPPPEILQWEKDLVASIGEKVKIKNNQNGSGQIIVTYSNRQQLENIIDKLKS